MVLFFKMTPLTPAPLTPAFITASHKNNTDLGPALKGSIRHVQGDGTEMGHLTLQMRMHKMFFFGENTSPRCKNCKNWLIFRVAQGLAGSMMRDLDPDTLGMCFRQKNPPLMYRVSGGSTLRLSVAFAIVSSST